MKVQSHFSIRKIACLFLLLVWIAVACCSLSAQTESAIIIRLLDSQTGNPIVPIAGDNGISVTVNESNVNPHLTARVNKDGLWELHLAQEIEKVQIDTPAGPGGWGYVFCDCSRFRPSQLPSYSVAEILKLGIVAPNHCNKRLAVAKPGEIVFFVRRPNWREKLPI